MFHWRPRKATRRLIIHSSHYGPEVTNQAAHMRARAHEMGLLEVGYHFVIERDGKLVTTRPAEAIGSHTPGYNHDSIGICLAGSSDHTPAQEMALGALVVSLMWDHGRLEVWGHTELNRYRDRELRCPVLDMDAFRAHLSTILTYEELPTVSQTKPSLAEALRLTPQQTLILAYLESGRTLTTKVAIVSLGIMSLSSRIAELRALGHKIEAEEAKDHFDRRYLKYRLEGATDTEGSGE